MSSVAVGTTEPEPKRRRLLDAGGPIEDDETARQKMKDAEVYEIGVDGIIGEWDGFDPDNVGDVKTFCPYVGATNAIEPMGYFAMKGDLPMMRWLYVNGADTRGRDDVLPLWFPMWMAATYRHNEACKWLFDHGAAKDVRRRTHESIRVYPIGRSPLHATFAFSIQRNLSRWLILNGALCKDDDSGELDVEIMKEDLRMSSMHSWSVTERKLHLEWANNLHRPRTSFLLFLSGALSRPKHAYRTRRAVTPVQVLGGKTEVLELIGDYVGFVRGREARIIRQLTEMLPDLIDSTV